MEHYGGGRKSITYWFLWENLICLKSKQMKPNHSKTYVFDFSYFYVKVEDNEYFKAQDIEFCWKLWFSQNWGKADQYDSQNDPLVFFW